MSVEITCDVAGIEDFKVALQRFDSGMQRQVPSQLASWAADVKALARQLVPVRTGYLQRSIYATIKEWVVNIGAEVAYALFVELGTRYMKAQPYLYPAIQEYLPMLEQIILEAIDRAKSEAGL